MIRTHRILHYKRGARQCSIGLWPLSVRSSFLLLHVFLFLLVTRRPGHLRSWWTKPAARTGGALCRSEIKSTVISSTYRGVSLVNDVLGNLLLFRSYSDTERIMNFPRQITSQPLLIGKFIEEYIRYLFHFYTLRTRNWMITKISDGRRKVGK